MPWLSRVFQPDKFNNLHKNYKEYSLIIKKILDLAIKNEGKVPLLTGNPINRTGEQNLYNYQTKIKELGLGEFFSVKWPEEWFEEFPTKYFDIEFELDKLSEIKNDLIIKNVIQFLVFWVNDNDGVHNQDIDNELAQRRQQRRQRLQKAEDKRQSYPYGESDLGGYKKRTKKPKSKRRKQTKAKRKRKVRKTRRHRRR
jgi:hypothetical protein